MWITFIAHMQSTRFVLNLRQRLHQNRAESQDQYVQKGEQTNFRAHSSVVSLLQQYVFVSTLLITKY